MSRIEEAIEAEVAERASKAVDEFKAQLRTAIGADRSIESLEELFARCRSELHAVRGERELIAAERDRLLSFANGVASALMMPHETTWHQRLARLIETVDAVVVLERFKNQIAQVVDLPVSTDAEALLDQVISRLQPKVHKVIVNLAQGVTAQGVVEALRAVIDLPARQS